MPSRSRPCFALLIAAGSLHAQVAATPAPEDLMRGRRLFEAQCARCHAIDGTGGLGPALTVPVLRQAPDDSTLKEVISQGIDGTAMPGAWQLAERDVRQVAVYVRSLGHVATAVLPGDSARGRRIFETKGG